MIETKLPPGPKQNLLLRRDFNIRRDILGYLRHSVEEYPGISRARLGPFFYVNISNPDYIEHVLLHRDIYVKGRDNKNLKFLLGEGLLTNEGEFWLKQRRLMQPVFHKQRLQGFVGKIAESTERMIHDWEQRKDPVMDIHAEMTRITLEVVSKTLMSTEVHGDFRKISHSLHELMAGMMSRAQSFLRLPYWLPIPRNIRMRQNRIVLNETIFQIIKERRESTNTFDDLMTMLMEVEDADTGERMSDQQLRDELITIFLAGHETTANALAFSFFLLAQHPEVYEKVKSEAMHVVKGSSIVYDDLQHLEYTTMVIKESMRLYPPAWGLLRDATRDDRIGNYKIKKGDTVVLPTYAVQRMSKYWKDPDVFDPERFLPERIKHVPKYAYFPFGGGARLCIGNNFAMMEMQIILALVCMKYKFSVAPGFKLELEPLVTLRPKQGVVLKLNKT